jgi:hypothetical protein
MTERPSFPADLVLTTERLTLRPLADADLDAIPSRRKSAGAWAQPLTHVARSW